MFQEEEVESSVTSEEDEAADIEDEELRECEYKILYFTMLVIKEAFLI